MNVPTQHSISFNNNVYYNFKQIGGPLALKSSAMCQKCQLPRPWKQLLSEDKVEPRLSCIEI